MADGLNVTECVLTDARAYVRARYGARASATLSDDSGSVEWVYHSPALDSYIAFIDCDSLPSRVAHAVRMLNDRAPLERAAIVRTSARIRLERLQRESLEVARSALVAFRDVPESPPPTVPHTEPNESESLEVAR